MTGRYRLTSMRTIGLLAARPGRERDAPTWKRSGGVLVSLLLLPVAISGCNHTSPASSASRSVTTPSRLSSTSGSATTTSVQSLPSVVGGVPLTSLASAGLRYSKVWDELHPTNARVGLVMQGGKIAAYLVEMTGHFQCLPFNGCAVSIPAGPPGSSTPALSTPTVAPLSYLTVSVPSTSTGGGLSVGKEHTLTGDVWDLQPYILAEE
jgi:hypothetical protein